MTVYWPIICGSIIYKSTSIKTHQQQCTRYSNLATCSSFVVLVEFILFIVVFQSNSRVCWCKFPLAHYSPILTSLPASACLSGFLSPGGGKIALSGRPHCFCAHCVLGRKPAFKKQQQNPGSSLLSGRAGVDAIRVAVTMAGWRCEDLVRRVSLLWPQISKPLKMSGAGLRPRWIKVV